MVTLGWEQALKDCYRFTIIIMHAYADEVEVVGKTTAAGDGEAGLCVLVQTLDRITTRLFAVFSAKSNTWRA